MRFTCCSKEVLQLFMTEIVGSISTRPTPTFHWSASFVLRWRSTGHNCILYSANCILNLAGMQATFWLVENTMAGPVIQLRCARRNTGAQNGWSIKPTREQHDRIIIFMALSQQERSSYRHSLTASKRRSPRRNTSSVYYWVASMAIPIEKCVTCVSRFFYCWVASMAIPVGKWVIFLFFSVSVKVGKTFN